MPDDKPGSGRQQEAAHNVAPPEAVNTPTPPHTPPSPPAQSVTNNGMEGAIHAVEDRVKRAEKLMIGLTGGIVLLTFGLVIVGILQWSAMRGQLREMQLSGATATDQLWQAIGNMNWMAKTADGSLHQTQRALEASDRQNKNTGAVMQRQLELGNRPWIGLADHPPGLSAGPLVFDASGNAIVAFTVNPKNFSSNAGQNVLPTVLLSVTEDLASLEKTQVEACGPVQYKEFGTVLFPGTNPIATNSTATVLRSQMTHPGYNGKFEVWLIGCIRYQDQFR